MPTAAGVKALRDGRVRRLRGDPLNRPHAETGRGSATCIVLIVLSSPLSIRISVWSRSFLPAARLLLLRTATNWRARRVYKDVQPHRASCAPSPAAPSSPSSPSLRPQRPHGPSRRATRGARDAARRAERHPRRPGWRVVGVGNGSYRVSWTSRGPSDGSDRPTIIGDGLRSGRRPSGPTAGPSPRSSPPPARHSERLDVVLSGDRLDEAGFDPSTGTATAPCRRGSPASSTRPTRASRDPTTSSPATTTGTPSSSPGWPSRSRWSATSSSPPPARTPDPGRWCCSCTDGTASATTRRTPTTSVTAGRARPRWRRSRATSATTTSSGCWRPRDTRPCRCGSTGSTPRTTGWPTAEQTPVRRSSRSTSPAGSISPPRTRPTSIRSSSSGTAAGAKASTAPRSRSARVRPYRIAGQVLLAPTDFAWHTAPYVPTVTVLPYCDGDVSDLQGQRFTDVARGLAAGDTSLKSSVMAMGTNHNFFNSEWTPGTAAAPSWDDWGGDATRPAAPPPRAAKPGSSERSARPTSPEPSTCSRARASTPRCTTDRRPASTRSATPTC